MSQVTRRAALVLSIAAAMGGCTDMSHDGPVQAVGREQASLYFYGLADWSSHRIPVCWEGDAYAYYTEKYWVKDAVTRTWQAHSDIEFTGWDACPWYLEPGKVRIKISDERAHTGGLGIYAAGIYGGVVLNFTFNNWSTGCAASTARESCIRSTAVHEFGHVLSFLHEQDRPDATTCQDQDTHSSLLAEDIPLGPYDPESIMNYCAPWDRWTLSDGDIQGVQRIYDISKPCTATLSSAPTSGGRERGSCHYALADGTCLVAVSESYLGWDHFYTTTLPDLAACTTKETHRRAFYLRSAASAPDTTTLYRCFHLDTHDSLLTTDGTCAAYGGRGRPFALGLIATRQLAGTSPLYRLSQGSNNYYTTSAVDRSNALAIGYTDQGVAGYAWTAPASTTCQSWTCAALGYNCGATGSGCTTSASDLGCGGCASGSTCQSNVCSTACVPSCTNKVCGQPDGCGDVCLRCAKSTQICEELAPGEWGCVYEPGGF